MFANVVALSSNSIKPCSCNKFNALASFDGSLGIKILSPFDIKLQKGETIGQGIIKPYFITEDDAAVGERTGGFGSTGA